MQSLFTGNIPSPKVSNGSLHANRKSRITYETKKTAEKFQTPSIPDQCQGIER
jgi:hypothetical protein